MGSLDERLADQLKGMPMDKQQRMVDGARRAWATPLDRVVPQPEHVRRAQASSSGPAS